MLNKIREKFSPTKLLKRKDQKGQSLVEMAIAAPLLLIMFLGVFEVGWALRGYIVLANVNRETTRFAVKNGVLDYSDRNPATVGYNTVLSHTAASLAAQLPLEFLDADPNATVIMSHFVAKTGFPCVKYQGGAPKVPYEFDPTCDCTVDDPDDPQWFTRDDLIAYPSPQYPHYSQTFGIERTTRLGGGSYEEAAKQLALKNNQFNCNVLKSGSTGELSIDNMFVAEAFYDQPQIFGVPFISNRLTDPIPFYTHTAMRIVSSRDADTKDTIGPACMVYPITFDDGIFPNPDDPPADYPIDAFQGSGTGQFGWLTWNPASSHNNAGYAYEELLNPLLSMHDFTNANDPDDHSLNIGDDVSSGPGVMNSDDVDDALESLEGLTILVPIYGTGGGTGANTYFTITHFAEITINKICLPRNSCPGVSGNDKRIEATFNRYVDDACTDGGSSPFPSLSAEDDTATTPRDTTITINVLGNDSGDGLSIISVSQADQGTASHDGSQVTYEPRNHATHGVGTFTFAYTIRDDQGYTASAQVTVTVTDIGVNAPPVAVNDSYSTGLDTPLTVAASGVLDNDTDADSDPLTASKVSDPANGSVTLNSDGSFTYTPDSGFSGTDSFTYQANDGTSDSNVATVSITVTAGTLVTIADDDFESGSWSGGSGSPGWSANWSRSGSPAPNVETWQPHTGSYSARMRNTGEISRIVDMSSVSSGAQLVFWWKARQFESGDTAVVEVYDGSSWHNVLTVSDGQADSNWHELTVDLSGYAMASNFMVRFKMQGNADNDYLFIDDIEITGYQ